MRLMLKQKKQFILQKQTLNYRQRRSLSIITSDWNFNRDAQITALVNNKQNHLVEGGLRNRSLQRKAALGQNAEGAAIHGKLI